jgi:hypothetical protein
MRTNRAIVAQGRIGWERVSANRSIRRIPERHLSRRDPPAPPFPVGAAMIRAAVEWPPAAVPHYLPPGPCGAMGATSADERLSRLVPRRSSELFEKLSLSGAPLRNRTVDLLLTIWRQMGRRRSLVQVSGSFRVV